MVVYHDNFSISVVPQSKHGVDEGLLHHFFRHNHGSRHSHVVVGMTSIVQRRKGEVDLIPFFCSVSSHPFQNLGNHEGIQTRVGMLSMIFCTPDRKKNNIILSPFFNTFDSGCVLNVTTGFPQFRRGRNLVLCQDLVQLFF
jgi:hypothetical protein